MPKLVCIYCQQHGNIRVKQELMMVPEARRAWEAYHGNVPRLYLPLRLRDHQDEGLVAGEEEEEEEEVDSSRGRLVHQRDVP